MIHRVHIPETAEAEVDTAYFWLLRHSPERASRWHEGLLQAIESLSEMPGRCPLARENDYFEPEVRQLLYGRGRNTYRILFTLIPDAEEGEPPIVRILHVLHGAQQTLGEEQEPGAS